jgi:CNT family concentrative nucleoside transporter
MQRFVGLLGIVILLAIAYLYSTERRAIRWKTVAIGVTLQFLFALFVLRVTWGRTLFQWAGDAVNKVLDNVFAGSTFVFGDLGAKQSHLGFFFAFSVLPTIIFVSALFAILYHYGIMQVVIKQFAKLMQKMGASGAESLNVAASIFVGQTEAPLTIRPFLPSLTKSELMTVMTAGMAHVSGGIMGAYIAFGIEAKHLLAAVIMTAPGTILMAKMLVPETEKPLTAAHRNPPGAAQAEASIDMDAALAANKDENVLGAIARGTTDGLNLAINVAAMLIAFLALISLANMILGGVHNHIAWFPGSLEKIFGFVFAPVALIIGIPWKDAVQVGNLLGTRMVINELVAFGNLGQIKNAIDPRSFTIATFALCGFANFSSIGIQIGGISALAPNKRGELAKLGFRAMIAGTMANLMSACIVGLLMK